MEASKWVHRRWGNLSLLFKYQYELHPFTVWVQPILVFWTDWFIRLDLTPSARGDYLVENKQKRLRMTQSHEIFYYRRYDKTLESGSKCNLSNACRIYFLSIYFDQDREISNQWLYYWQFSFKMLRLKQRGTLSFFSGTHSCIPTV